MKQFPVLYNIVRKKNQTMASSLNNTPLNISYGRVLVGDKLREWNRLVSMVIHVNLEEAQDLFVWKANQSSIFSVKSMYMSLMQENSIPDNYTAWKLRCH
jgi:hypothetical protein